MMDWLFPDSVDLSQVQFLPRHEEDSLQNYSVLQAAFKKTGVVQVGQKAALRGKVIDIQTDKESSFKFLLSVFFFLSLIILPS